MWVLPDRSFRNSATFSKSRVPQTAEVSGEAPKNAVSPSLHLRPVAALEQAEWEPVKTPRLALQGSFGSGQTLHMSVPPGTTANTHAALNHMLACKSSRLVCDLCGPEHVRQKGDTGYLVSGTCVHHLKQSPYWVLALSLL